LLYHDLTVEPWNGTISASRLELPERELADRKQPPAGVVDRGRRHA